MSAGPKSFLIAWAMLFLSQPTLAQESPQTGQSMIDAQLAYWDEESLKTLGHLAECVAERHPQAADTFVQDVSDSTLLERDQARLVDEGCIKQYWFRSSRTKVEPDIYRRLLGEALLTLAYADAPLPAVDEVTQSVDNPHLPAVPLDEVHPYYRSIFIIDRHYGELNAYSECVARAQPQEVFALMSTDLDSSEETSALAALDAAATECIALRPNVTFPSFLRRGDLLQQLYLLTRLAGAPVPQREN